MSLKLLWTPPAINRKLSEYKVAEIVKDTSIRSREHTSIDAHYTANLSLIFHRLMEPQLISTSNHNSDHIVSHEFNEISPTEVAPQMSNAAINHFLNAKFPNIESLNSVDTVIHEIETAVAGLDNTAEVDTTSRTVLDTSKANDFLEKLRGYVKSPTEDGLDELNDLIAKYGNIPAITYTRDLLEQKLKLLKEGQIRREFVQVLDKLNDFEIFELNDITNIASSHDERVKVYEKVSELKQEINTFQKNAEAANFHIDVNITEMSEELETKLSDIVRSDLCEAFKQSLIKIVNSWDSEHELHRPQTLSSATLSEFSLLLNLQLNAMPNDKLVAGSSSDLTLWAVDCLTDKFRTKFIYHFEGNGETNRLDKPEFAFSYLVGYLRKNIEFAKVLFAADFGKCAGGRIPGSFSTWFIASTLIPLKRKFTKEISLLLETDNSQLLSHFVAEVKKFDEEVKQEFAFIPLKGHEWGGLTNDLILSRDVVWNAWLQNEKNFVNKRFEEIVQMEDAFLIDYDLVENGKTKPTKSAVNLKNLLEGITVNYDSLPLKFQLKFLSEVQLKLLNFYFDTLKKGVQALKNIKHVQIDGVSTLERICRIWCSSKYIIETMDKWSDETLFIELWQSLSNESESETTFFESVIKGYDKEIMSKIPNLINSYFERQLNRTMKGYFQENTDWTFKTGKDSNDGSSNELDFVIQTLNTDLAYLRKTVSSTSYNSWKLLLSNTVISYFEKNIALVNNFSPPGTQKLEKDINKVVQSLELVKSYDHYGRLMSILHVLQTGKFDSSDEKYPPMDDSELTMLVMRRR